MHASAAKGSTGQSLDLRIGWSCWGLLLGLPQLPALGEGKRKMCVTLVLPHCLSHLGVRMGDQLGQDPDLGLPDYMEGVGFGFRLESDLS